MSKKVSREDELKQKRQIRRVMVDLNIFGRMLRDGIDTLVKAEGLPKTAIFLGASYQPDYYACSFFYADESFEPVEEGTVVPVLDVVLIRIAAPSPDTNVHKEEK